ncbi:autotransporter domain-containing protein [Fusobacterium ulcerans]|uniref:autotransporter domain-containing protein n=1 Tax=Fusobacterium ulcerans TaxID=861 RepID=UPI003FEEDB5F
MIEKIMKAVKSGNKKRGRNITIGAVVGMLLSCTAVMGADEDKYLWVKENGSGALEFSTIDEGGSGNFEKNPYEENELTGNTYVNNMTLTGNNNGEDITIGGYSCEISYGIKLELTNYALNFVNNGVISGTGEKGGASVAGSYGIYVLSNNLGEISNNGMISEGTLIEKPSGGTPGSYAAGIHIAGDNFGNINNNGVIFIHAEKTGIEELTDIVGEHYGIYIGNDNEKEIINNGLFILPKNKRIYIYTIRVNNDNKGDITNNGAIIGKIDQGSLKVDNGFTGIILWEGNEGTIKNNGMILSNGTAGGNGSNKGINLRGTNTGVAINNGVIFGENNRTVEGIFASQSNGVDIMNNGTISSIAATCTVSGKDYRSGYGINLMRGQDNTGVITNTGVAYGNDNAIKISETNNGTVNNYGVLVSDDGNVIADDAGDEIAGNNYGIKYKTNGGSVVINGDSTSEEILVGYEGKTKLKRTMAIKNLENGGFGDKNYENTILNSLKDTYSAKGTSNTINGSIINAYETAIVYDATDGGELILSGTVVNGGVKKNTKAVLGSDKEDTLILKAGNVSYNEEVGTKSENTVINGNIDMKDGADTLVAGDGTRINGNIDMGAGDDNLTIGSGTIINGTLAGGNGSDTLEFGKISAGKTFSNTDKEMNIFYDISNFENINVNSNVTFYEKTVKADDGTAKGLEVTGAKEIKIGENGALTLRIDTTNKDGEKIKGHALYGNTGTITSEGGKLLLALNGAGNESIISFGATELGDGLDANTLGTTSKLHTLKKLAANEVEVIAVENLPDYLKYPQLNKIYHGILSVDDLIGNFNVEDDEKLSIFLAYLNDIYAGNPYSYSSELSRKSAGMFRDIVTENIFRPETNKWMIYGGLTHVDGGTKDTYYGKGYYTYDIGSSDMDADTKITGAYMLGEYGVSDTLTSGVVIGGNKLKSDLSNGSKVDGSAMYLGAYAKKYIGNLKVTAGAGFQYGDYDADRLAVNKVASDSAESVMKYSDNYNDITYDIYLNGRYSHNIGDNLFLEPYATLSYTYIDQDGANEGSKVLAIETDSKSFDYTVGKVGVDLKKVIPHEKGKSTLSAGVSYTKILDGADEEHITGRFKGGSDFDILVAHKNEHSIGLNAKYALELENGVIFDVKGTYSVERDSHNQSGKNRTKGEWIVGAGIGYKF